MPYIKLTQGRKALVDEEDYEKLSRFNWHFHHEGGAQRKLNCKQVPMEQFILGQKDGLEIDHINHDRLDNRRSNLRFCTRAQNAMNRRKRRGCKYAYKGVFQNNQLKFTVRIVIEGERRSVGTFATLIEAANAYNHAALKHYGDFASPNPVKEREG